MAKKTTRKAAKTATRAKTGMKAVARGTKGDKNAKQVTPLAKVNPASSPRTKGEIFGLLAETTGLTRKDVSTVFASLTDIMGKDLGKKGCGLFTVPGLMKVRVVHKPATKARKGINPFTGEETTFKAKPARNIVKIRPLKALKDMV